MNARILPTVSVVIPVYNSASTLERAVRSAMAQSLRHIEILIADDGSTDNSAAVALALAAEDQRIQFIRLPKNGGKSRAMNVMIARARGEWIAVLDADDRFDPHRLLNLISVAEAHGTDLVADNLAYFDAGVGRILRTGFPPFAMPKMLTKQDILSNNNSFAHFDYGLLKPVLRRSFIETHDLRYYENTRLAEDFYYLLSFFVAGGHGCLVGEALYAWTLPFGTQSRTWTTTGAGAWRYNYREALTANTYFMAQMQAKGEFDVVAMLRARAAQYRVMIHYLDAQRHAAERRWLAAFSTILRHPSTYALLFSRVIGRIGRMWSQHQGWRDRTRVTTAAEVSTS